MLNFLFICFILKEQWTRLRSSLELSKISNHLIKVCRYHKSLSQLSIECIPKKCNDKILASHTCLILIQLASSSNEKCREIYKITYIGKLPSQHMSVRPLMFALIYTNLSSSESLLIISVPRKSELRSTRPRLYRERTRASLPVNKTKTLCLSRILNLEIARSFTGLLRILLILKTVLICVLLFKFLFCILRTYLIFYLWPFGVYSLILFLCWEKLIEISNFVFLI